MSGKPAGSERDTAELAQLYSETSLWQHQRGMMLIDVAAIEVAESVLDIGCGTGELTKEIATRVGPAGKVMAADPDARRLEMAKSNLTPGFGNVELILAPGEDLRAVADASQDLVYSNYAFHWVLDTPALFAEIARVLRPGGRLVTEFLGAPIELFVDLIMTMPTGSQIVTENLFLTDAQWRESIGKHPFTIHTLEWPRFSFDYENLDALLDWLEATSQGGFDRKKMSVDDRTELGKRFPDKVSVECTGLRMELFRA